MIIKILIQEFLAFIFLILCIYTFIFISIELLLHFLKKKSEHQVTKLVWANRQTHVHVHVLYEGAKWFLMYRRVPRIGLQRLCFFTIHSILQYIIFETCMHTYRMYIHTSCHKIVTWLLHGCNNVMTTTMVTD